MRSVNKAGGNLIVNVFSYEADTLSSPINYNSVASDMATQWLTQYLSILSTIDTCLDLTVTQNPQTGVAPGQGIHVVNLDGTRALTTPDLGIAVCGLVTLKTATPKRYARGHLFMPPAYDVAAFGSGGNINAANAYATAINAWAARALQPFTAGSTSYNPIIYSHTEFNKGQAQYTFPVLSHLLKPEMHYLRSRSSSP